MGSPCSLPSRHGEPIGVTLKKNHTATLLDSLKPTKERHVQRLRRSLGLRVPPTKGKGVRRGLSTGLPTKAEHRGHVWSWDFISDATTRGGALRMLTILDEYTRECHVLRADRALKSGDVLDWIGRAIAEHGSPAYLRSDNGPEFIANDQDDLYRARQSVAKWLRRESFQHRVKTPYTAEVEAAIIQIPGRRKAARLRMSSFHLKAGLPKGKLGGRSREIREHQQAPGRNEAL